MNDISIPYVPSFEKSPEPYISSLTRSEHWVSETEINSWSIYPKHSNQVVFWALISLLGGLTCPLQKRILQSRECIHVHWQRCFHEIQTLRGNPSHCTLAWAHQEECCAIGRSMERSAINTSPMGIPLPLSINIVLQKWNNESVI